jgi:hypothetical protein
MHSALLDPFSGELFRGPLAERAVQPLLAVFALVGPEQVLRFDQALEQLPVEQLVSKPAVEALHESVLPGASRRDEQRPDAALGEPVPNRFRDELGTVVEYSTSPAPVPPTEVRYA